MAGSGMDPIENGKTVAGRNIRSEADNRTVGRKIITGICRIQRQNDVAVGPRSLYLLSNNQLVFSCYSRIGAGCGSAGKLFSSISAQLRRYCVSRTLEARDGFQELQEGFMRFLKHNTFGA